MRIPILFVLVFLGKSSYSAYPNWTVIPQSYQYQMTLSSRVSIRCSDTNNKTVLVGAFINGICRGVDTNNILINGYYYTFITIFSNQQIGEKVYFKLYDPTTDVVYDGVDSIDFENNKVESSITYPYKLMSNYKPERIVISSTAIYNVLPINTVVANLSTIDKNNTNFQYSILPEPGLNTDYFSISGNSLVIQKLLISDTNKKLKVKIQTDDLFGCTLDSIVTFDVVNTDPPPTGLILMDSIIFEHSSLGALARKLLAQDASPADTHVFELVTGEGSSGNANFRIEGNQLLVNADIEFSNASTLPIRIKITDRARNTKEVMTSIALKEFVYTIAPTENTINEHVSIGTVAKEIKVEDVNNSGPYNISLVSGEGSQDNYRYSIVDNQLIVNSDIEYDSAILHYVRVAIVNSFGNKIEFKLNVIINEILNPDQPLKANNLVTPNSDGINDVFEIQNIHLYKDFHVTFLDDNGSVTNTYSPSQPYTNNWNGLSQTGVPLPSGTYYYYFRSVDNFFTYKGAIQLLQPDN